MNERGIQYSKARNVKAVLNFGNYFEKCNEFFAIKRQIVRKNGGFLLVLQKTL